MRNKIQLAIQDSLEKMGVDKEVIVFDNTNFGDYSSNIAMTLAKELKESPLVIAQKIVNLINKDQYEISKIEIAPPGFLNFFVKSNVHKQIVDEILDNPDSYGSQEENKKINIEFVSANPTGFLHVAHARGAVLGSTLANILAYLGNKVIREYYVNDSGSQIDRLAISVFTRYLQALGKNIEMPEDSYIGEDIIWLANQFVDIFGNHYLDANYEDVKDIFKNQALEILLNKIKSDLATLNVHFDVFTSEKSLITPMSIEQTINKLNNTYHHDGALWLNTTSQGDDKDRVLIKKDGSNTYLLPDIVYHNDKLTRKPKVDHLINIWGADHLGYIKRMQVALTNLGYDENICTFLICQTVRLLKDGQEFKMSKRKGNAIFLSQLIELTSVDATRYFMISRSNNSGIDFDIDVVTESNNENPVYIIQYSFARTVQLLKNATVEMQTGDYQDEKSIKLINTLAEFPNLIKSISKNYKVHLLPQYLLKLSKEFNSFYSNVKIINTEKEPELLALVQATQIVLQIGLKLIGVSAPERM